MTSILIGLTGRKGSGKDTAASALEGFENVKMAGALKAMLAALLAYQGAGDTYIDECLEGDLKEQPCPYLGHRTPRHAMQTLGTEWGREMIHENLWVAAAERRIGQFHRIVVTDVRFQNEVDLIHELGGQVYRVIRPSIEDELADGHVSEAGVAALRTDGHIINDFPSAEAFAKEMSAGLGAYLFRRREPVSQPTRKIDAGLTGYISQIDE